MEKRAKFNNEYSSRMRKEITTNYKFGKLTNTTKIPKPTKISFTKLMT